MTEGHGLKPMVWRTQDGEEIEVGSMRTRHLTFALRMINARGNRWRANYKERIELVLDIRSLLVTKKFRGE